MGHGRVTGEATVWPTRDKPCRVAKPVDEDIERMIHTRSGDYRRSTRA